jgi:hypothetical protein
MGWSVAVQPAAAGISWCRSDPVVLFTVEDGGLLGSAVLADIFVSAPLPILLNVTGPNQVVVTTPPGVSAVLAISDLGFGRGEVVTFQQSDTLTRTESGFQTEVAVYVPARKDLAVEVNVAPRILGLLWPASAAGRTNQWIVFRTTI